ncbi:MULTISPECIES: TIR domain-containing protein [unclassified Candidatus Nanosynbacter]|uniref:TIR domain-containing protein n=1 Tax=unclassified Candidatus Nanosynbacter TaxID=2725944 RepID=UPI00101C8A7D|nr:MULTISPECIES: TIR domain-containing protein [unclassified Candidatus Nanosynbacter]MCJ1963486.1 TIR domain-containing protein [Candidatus Nanosynbacter sp. TM7-033]UOG67973.1 TIR domain-containing protein [Candidatus Nanosynbacter sp. HMT-352]
MKRQVFYSFHFDNDVMRVWQIRKMGAIEGNEPVAPNNWEQIKRSEYAVKKWIDDNMKYKSCVIVLVGSETASRKWVDYEIRKAWNEGKGLFGIYIHNLKDPITGTCRKGANPFDNVLMRNGQRLSSLVSCYDPNSWDAYNDIAKNLENWVEEAISTRENY